VRNEKLQHDVFSQMLQLDKRSMHCHEIRYRRYYWTF